MKEQENPTLEQIAIEQDALKDYKEGIRQEYLEQARREKEEAEIENERPNWNINS